MRIKLAGMPKLKLLDLLRRRKTTLRRFIDESAIWTYESLVAECKRLGVSPPLQEEVIDIFPKSNPPKLSDPPEGIVVLDIPALTPHTSLMQPSSSSGLVLHPPPSILLHHSSSLQTEITQPTESGEGDDSVPHKKLPKRRKVDQPLDN